MGYDVHITRKGNWFDESGPEIALEEWTALLGGDPEMRLDGFAEIQNEAGEGLRFTSEGLAVWVSYSGHGKDGNMAWFDYRSGSIAVKNPDAEILGKMWRIAQILSAKVQGDDGELYDESGALVSEPQPPHRPPQEKARPWWKLW